jgi:protein-L-isoaspartate(D-aspartate) O-methyltransferase
LKINDLFSGLREVARVKKKDAWICVESYRNEHEKANLLYWQLTCESFYSPEEWQWIYDYCGYDGDFEFIYFE